MQIRYPFIAEISHIKSSFKVNRAVINFKDILLLCILKQLIYLVKSHILKHISNISSSRNMFRLFDINELSITI